MKKSLILGVFILSIVVSVLFHQTARAELKMVTARYEPFAWEEDGEVKGFLVDIFNEALEKRMGVHVSWQELPWIRAQVYVKDGEADGFVSPITAEREQYATASQEVVVEARISPFTRVNHPDAATLSQITTYSGFKEFTVLDFLGNGWAQENLVGNGLTLDESTTIEQVIKKLAAGRGDVFIHIAQVAHAYIKKTGLKGQVIELPNVLDTIHFHLMIGNASSYVSILPEFDKTIRAMREDGSLQAIYEQYE